MKLSRFHLVLLDLIFGSLELELDPQPSTPSDGHHLPPDGESSHIHTPPGQLLPAQQDIPASLHNRITTSDIYPDTTRFG